MVGLDESGEGLKKFEKGRDGIFERFGKDLWWGGR